MSSINSVVVSGNLTRDAELQRSANGSAFLHFTVAVNDRVKDSNGNWTDKANFTDWTIFGKRAESIAEYLRKGTFVVVSGKLDKHTWDGKDGQKRSKIQFVAWEIEFKTNEYQAPAPAPAPQENEGQAVPTVEGEPIDAQIPF